MIAPLTMPPFRKISANCTVQAFVALIIRPTDMTVNPAKGQAAVLSEFRPIPAIITAPCVVAPGTVMH